MRSSEHCGPLEVVECANPPLFASRRTQRLVLAGWGLTICLVVVLSVLPALLINHMAHGLLPQNDKVAHFAAYVVLALIPVAALEYALTGILLAALMVPMGVVLEFVQRLVPGRDFDLVDMTANSLGVLTGITLALLIRRLWRKRFA